ncbi:cupin domain-containing protein [Amnibacterium endophyticum]|uniref:Cupin domain-containing protein n=1 Tax=Amnibacterium endophyticum TaxID=2109337 RepID=A0ABW4LJA8_9MICO
MEQQDVVGIAAALDGLTEHWSPKVVARVNDQYVKVAKLLGELVWHAHDDEDELFLVVSGRLRIQLEGRDEVRLGPGELFVVPRGVRHNPIAEEEVRIVLVETVTTAHTGSVVVERTRSIEEQLGR